MVCESEILFDFQMGRGVMTDDHRRYTCDTDHIRQTLSATDDTLYCRLYCSGIFYMYCCLFCIVLYSSITVYAVGDVLSKNIRRRFDTDYGVVLVVSFVISYRASYTLSIVYSLVCIVICIDIYDMGRVGGQKYTVLDVLFIMQVRC